MAHPVVHFEIAGKDRSKTSAFLTELFGWNITDEPKMDYSMVKSDGTPGIGGGVRNTEGDEKPNVIFYVQTSDVQATLDKAVSLGGEVTMPLTEIPNIVTLAQFKAPDGNVIGLVKEAETQ